MSIFFLKKRFLSRVPELDRNSSPVAEETLHSQFCCKQQKRRSDIPDFKLASFTAGSKQLITWLIDTMSCSLFGAKIEFAKN